MLVIWISDNRVCGLSAVVRGMSSSRCHPPKLISLTKAEHSAIPEHVQLMRSPVRAIHNYVPVGVLHCWTSWSTPAGTTTATHSKCPPPSVWPHLFCGAGHEKRRGEQLKWSLAFMLYIVFHVHSYQDQLIQPGWAECVFLCIFSLGLCFVCLFVLFDLFVSPFLCVSLGSWVISLTVFGAIVTNLNEPLRALATSTIMWVRS